MKTLYYLIIILLITTCTSLDVSAQGDFTLQTAPVPDDDYWDEGFGNPILANPEVTAVALSGDSIYIAEEGRILFFNPGLNRWLTLGIIDNANIFTLAAHDGKLYVGGSFEGLEGYKKIRFIASWDGSRWDSLPGLDGRVNAIEISPAGHLYAGGDFKVPGTSEDSYNIAMWDGASWKPLGAGLNDAVTDIVITGNKLYASGDFFLAGETEANYIAVWDMESKTWSALGEGISGESTVKVTSLAAGSDGSIYAAGSFDMAGTVIAQNIAKWDGQSWSGLGEGTNSLVYDLSAHDGLLYAGGSFTKAGSTDAIRIAVWNGSGWQAVSNDIGGGSYPSVTSLAVDSEGILFVCGSFTQAGPVRCGGFARWDGSEWSNPFAGAGRNGTRSMVHGFSIDSDNNLYVGGSFVQTGDLEMSGLSLWDGDSWQALNKGLARPGSVYYLTTVGRDCYFTGWFLGADDTLSLNNVAKWEADTRRWRSIGNGINGGDFDLGPIVWDGKDFYIGGNFTEVDGLVTNHIVRRDGSAWHTLGSGLTGSTVFVESIALGSDGEIYAGGRFTKAGETTVANIAVWDPSTESWSALAEGINGTVITVVPHGDDIYVGGLFNKAGNVKASNLAKWNKSSKTWTAIGDSINGYVMSVLPYMGKLYIGGNFNKIGSVNASALAVYDPNENSFSPLGSGLQYGLKPGQVRSLIVYKNKLYVGGQFTTAGTKISSNMARWTNIPVSVEEKPVDIEKIVVSCSPNPSDGDAVLSFNLAESGEIGISLFTGLGQKIASLAEGYFEAGSYSISLSIYNMPSGIYLARINSGLQVKTEKINIIK